MSCRRHRAHHWFARATAFVILWGIPELILFMVGVEMTIFVLVVGAVVAGGLLMEVLR